MRKTMTLPGLLFVTTLLACKHKPPRNQYPAGLIPVDSANKMVESYINSINFQTNDSSIESFTVNAADLRLLLDSVAGCTEITSVQIKFGHQLDYINNGNANQFAGYNKNALTVLLVGVKDNGQYVYANGAVLNHARPCPNNCPPGEAGEPLFIR